MTQMSFFHSDLCNDRSLMTFFAKIGLEPVISQFLFRIVYFWSFSNLHRTIHFGCCVFSPTTTTMATFTPNDASAATALLHMSSQWLNFADPLKETSVPISSWAVTSTISPSCWSMAVFLLSTGQKSSLTLNLPCNSSSTIALVLSSLLTWHKLHPTLSILRILI